MATYSNILPWRNPMDRETWWATVYGAARSWIWLNNWVHTHTVSCWKQVLFIWLVLDESGLLLIFELRPVFLTTSKWSFAGLPWWLSKQSACQCSRCKRHLPWVGKIACGRTWQHSSILAWRIPWTEEPGQPQSIGSQRVGHGWNDLTCTQDHWQFRSRGHMIQSLRFYEGPRVNQRLFLQRRVASDR